jgi:hypothetical protein
MSNGPGQRGVTGVQKQKPGTGPGFAMYVFKFPSFGEEFRVRI